MKKIAQTLFAEFAPLRRIFVLSDNSQFIT